MDGGGGGSPAQDLREDAWKSVEGGERADRRPPFYVYIVGIKKNAGPAPWSDRNSAWHPSIGRSASALDHSAFLTRCLPRRAILSIP